MNENNNIKFCNCSDKGKHTDTAYHSAYCQYSILQAGQKSDSNDANLPSIKITSNGNVKVDWNL